MTLLTRRRRLVVLPDRQAPPTSAEDGAVGLPKGPSLHDQAAILGLEVERIAVVALPVDPVPQPVAVSEQVAPTEPSAEPVALVEQESLLQPVVVPEPLPEPPLAAPVSERLARAAPAHPRTGAEEPAVSTSRPPPREQGVSAPRRAATAVRVHAADLGLALLFLVVMLLVALALTG